MRISLIAAVADNGVIGIENRLPWRLPADMAWFRRHTMSKPVLMGRATFESIGKPLPGRTNVVLSRDPMFRPEGVIVAASIEEALTVVAREPEVMVIGGENLYRQMLPRADRLYLTRVHGQLAGDAWFPEIDAGEWSETERSDHSPDEKNAYPYSFVILERRGI